MSRCLWSFTWSAVFLLLWLSERSSVQADVDLEWRPASQTVLVGEVVEVSLFAVAEVAQGESVSVIQVIVVWDASSLSLLPNVDPCQGGTCPADGFEWMSSGFPDDSQDDGVNNSFLDGIALYRALAPVLGGISALATPEGLWVTTLRFRTLKTAHRSIRMAERIGASTWTRVVSGDVAGLDITGTLGPQAGIDIVGCPQPVGTAIGSRYLAITPAAGPDPIALFITGDMEDPAVSCVAQYVQADGTLGQDPVFQTPDEWGTVHLGDLQIIPGAGYNVQAGCGLGGAVEVFSSPGIVGTWLWGDVNNNGCVYIDDVTAVINGSQGIFGEGVLVENLDLIPCRPDGVIDVLDEQAVCSAYNGSSYPCAMPCGAGPTLEDLGEFVACQAGPGNMVQGGCVRFDGDGDGDVDLADFAGFQSEFDAPF